MNERNVEALEETITSALVESDQGGGGYPTPRYLAELLAARGVLVPSALTDREAESVAGQEDWAHDADGNEFRADQLNKPSEVRAALERIAKGDA